MSELKDRTCVINIENKKADYNKLIGNDMGKKLDIIRAIQYTCEELAIDNPLKLNCKIIVSEKYKDEYNTIHFQPEKNESNGTIIPPIFQKSEYKNSQEVKSESKMETVILINSKLISNPQFMTSVIVHELSHCNDYVFKLPELEEKYRFKYLESISGTVGNFIGGYYCWYSEVRAKYLQEKYSIEKGIYKDCNQIFYKSPNCGNSITKLTKGLYNFDEIKNREDVYHAQHCAGKIRCWEELFQKNSQKNKKQESEIVDQIKEYCFYQDEYSQLIMDMYNAWDWNWIIKACNKIYEDFNKKIDEIVPESYQNEYLNR